MLTHKANSKKSHSFCNHLLLIIIVVLIFFNIISVPSALSQRAATNIVFYEENQIKQFNEGQHVKFFGVVNYHTSEGAVAVQNAYYQIINKDTGTVIGSGYTDNRGTFEFSWTAESASGTKQANLQAIFPGSSGYPYAESKVYTLEIFRPQKYHDVSLYLDVTKGSRSDSITVKPTMTYDYGTSLSYGYTVGGTTDFIKIYVNGQQKALVRPNQWSNDIIVGHGTHNVFAQSPEITDNSLVDIFRTSTSNTVPIDLPLPPPPKYHDVSISLDWQKSSSSDSIKVKPSVTYDNGITVPYDSDVIDIYVGTQYKASVRPNQWSGNIYLGYGTYTVFAQSQEIIDSNFVDIFRSSKSNTQSITLKPPPPIIQGGTSGSVTVSTQDPTIFIILGVVAAIGGGVAVAMMKRKKPTPRSVPQDDTQIW